MRLWIVSELFYPDQVGSAYLLTHIARGLAVDMPVEVVTGPIVDGIGVLNDEVEGLEHVHVTRCFSTTFNKDSLPLRVINALSGALSMSIYALLRLRSSDVVVVLTSPPLLPFFMWVVAAIRRVPCILLVHDVYPEVLTATGLASDRSILARMLSAATRALYRRMTRLIVIGRDMKELVLRKDQRLDSKIAIITNWADTDIVRPTARADNPLLRELGLQDRFVVQYAGNMGRTHDVESIIDAAGTLESSEPGIHFLFLGDGAKRRWVESESTSRRLGNVTLLPTRPRAEQPVFLNACDVAVISFVAGMSGVSMPSRTYNVMAAGKPIIAIADDTSELARLVREESIGWVIAPGDRAHVSRRLCEVLREACGDRAALEQMGRRARRAAERQYSFPSIIAQYGALLSPFDAGA